MASLRPALLALHAAQLRCGNVQVSDMGDAQFITAACGLLCTAVVWSSVAQKRGEEWAACWG